MKKKILIVELDVTSQTDSFIVALQKIDHEMHSEVNKHVIVRQRLSDEIINVPSSFYEPFVLSVREEERD